MQPRESAARRAGPHGPAYAIPKNLRPRAGAEFILKRALRVQADARGDDKDAAGQAAWRLGQKDSWGAQVRVAVSGGGWV